MIALGFQTRILRHNKKIAISLERNSEKSVAKAHVTGEGLGLGVEFDAFYGD